MGPFNKSFPIGRSRNQLTGSWAYFNIQPCA